MFVVALLLALRGLTIPEASTGQLRAWTDRKAPPLRIAVFRALPQGEHGVGDITFERERRDRGREAHLALSDSGLRRGGRAAAGLAFIGAQTFPESPEPVWSEGFLKRMRRQFRGAAWQFRHALKTWWPYLVRAALFLMFAILVGIIDRRLIDAWRQEGLRALYHHVPLMVYVYVSLFFDRRVPRLKKIALVVCLLYGAIPSDIVPDRSPEARLDDLLLIGVAARAFVATCSEELVLETARRAVRWQQRTRSLQHMR